MELFPTVLPGLTIIRPKIFEDARGMLVKTFHSDVFRDHGLEFVPREEFFSTSVRNVLRGMHFQLPPTAHSKLVYCIAGRVLDVVLDLRRKSPAFGLSCARELSATNREMFFIPVGCAHGFLALEDGTTMVYQTSTVHSPADDGGVRWNSFGFDWPVKHPILSDRDQRFPIWRCLSSPF
jgi:dTDP-4-dehydrorhamnose 3,5-epimerase